MAIVRLSGADAVSIARRLFRPALASGATATAAAAPTSAAAAATAAASAATAPPPARNGAAAWRPRSHRVYYGSVVDGAGRMLDEVPWALGGSGSHTMGWGRVR